jgi:hypothetical protein
MLLSVILPLYTAHELLESQVKRALPALSRLGCSFQGSVKKGPDSRRDERKGRLGLRLRERGGCYCLSLKNTLDPVRGNPTW